MKLISKVFNKNKYALYHVNKPFRLKTSKGMYQMELHDIIGIRHATSDKSKLRIIDTTNPNAVVSIPLKGLQKLRGYLTYQVMSKQKDIFNE